MFTVDSDAWKAATATAQIEVCGYSRAQIEMEAMEQAAEFFDCSRDEIVLTAPAVFDVKGRSGEHPFRPTEWRGVFDLAHVSVESRSTVLADDEG